MAEEQHEEMLVQMGALGLDEDASGDDSGHAGGGEGGQKKSTKKRQYVPLSPDQKAKIVQYYDQSPTKDKQKVLEWSKSEFGLEHKPSISARYKMLKDAKENKKF